MICSQLYTLHTQIVQSQDPDAKYSSFGENTTLQTYEEWPVRVLIRSPLDTLHTSMVLSQDPDANQTPVGENTTLQTGEEWPVRV